VTCASGIIARLICETAPVRRNWYEHLVARILPAAGYTGQTDLANAEPHAFPELYIADDFLEAITVGTNRYMETTSASAVVQDREREISKGSICG